MSVWSPESGSRVLLERTGEICISHLCHFLHVDAVHFFFIPFNRILQNVRGMLNRQDDDQDNERTFLLHFFFDCQCLFMSPALLKADSHGCERDSTISCHGSGRFMNHESMSPQESAWCHPQRSAAVTAAVMLLPSLRLVSVTELQRTSQKPEDEILSQTAPCGRRPSAATR